MVHDLYSESWSRQEKKKSGHTIDGIEVRTQIHKAFTNMQGCMG